MPHILSDRFTKISTHIIDQDNLLETMTNNITSSISTFDDIIEIYHESFDITKATYAIHSIESNFNRLMSKLIH
jgi:hypothetical protein